MRPAAAFLPALALTVTTACNSSPPGDRSFDADTGLLRARADAVVLDSGTGKLVVSPALQGRVVTSTLGDGVGLGFVNRELITHPPAQSAFYNYGGEDRFWMGPEGGPYAMYFAPGQEFKLENWQVPADLNSGAFRVVGSDSRRVDLQRDMHLSNRLGTRFDLRVSRRIDVPTQKELEALLHGPLPAGAQWVAYRSSNEVQNTGARAWTRDSGLPCIWILGMFTPGPRSFVIAPFRNDPALTGPPVQTGYFGALGPERLRQGSNFVLFRADAQYRSKIGLYPERVQPTLGAYDPDSRVLTLVYFQPMERGAPYLNELWNANSPEPYHGDVANSYNHGGPEQFFELESSSPALELQPGESRVHEHATVHLRLERDADLAQIARATLGVDWNEVARLAGW